MKYTRLLALGIVLLLGAFIPALAQVSGGVVFIPPVTANHCAAWSSSNVLKDSGGSCGGGGSPGGSNTQLQYNNSSAFGGISGATSNGTAVTFAPNDIQLSGSSSGTSTINAPATGGGTNTLPPGTVGIVGGPASATSGHLATFNGTTGQLIQDGGAVPTGTVTSVATGAGLTGGTCTTTCTISGTYLIRANTATTDTIVAGDASKLVTENNASPVAVTLPQATGSFGAGFAYAQQNLGAGTVTITPATSTINGASTLTLVTNQGCTIVSDGTNWQVSNCTAVGSSGGSGTVNSGTSPDVAYYAANGTAVSDGGGNVIVNVGALNVSGSSAAAPANGLRYVGGGDMRIMAGNANVADITSSNIQFNQPPFGSPAGSWSMQNQASSTTAPVFTPSRGDTASGLGGAASVPAMIVSSTSIENWASTGPSILVIPSDTATTDNTLCIKTSGGTVEKGSGTLGVCLGTSSMRAAKSAIAPISPERVLNLKPVTFFYRNGFGDNGDRKQHGFIAEDFSTTYPELTRFDNSGHPNGVDILGVVPDAIAEIEFQQREIDELWIAIGVLTASFIGGFVYLNRRAA